MGYPVFNYPGEYCAIADIHAKRQCQKNQQIAENDVKCFGHDWGVVPYAHSDDCQLVINWIIAKIGLDCWRKRTAWFQQANRLRRAAGFYEEMEEKEFE